MTALRDAIDTTTLGWIKPEIDETLRQARGEIEAFAENPADTTLMRACASFLHQVHGTLRMVELYAPAMVAEEMERLAHALVVPQGAKGAVADRDEACGALMRGVVLLPDYLERLQGGHKDIPIVLLPLLNELRAARGETGLSESVLFVPNLDRPLPDSLPAPMPLPRQSRQLMAAQQLTALREALATWPEDGTPANIVGIAKAIDGLLESADHEATRRMLWVASSVATALRDGALPPTRALRQAFSGVEREARHIFEGEAAASFRVDPGTEPTRQLLYHVAHNEQAHGALDALRDTFDLAAQLPTESELAHARGSLSGRNRALLDTVAAAIKEDLLRVKDALDLHLRTKQTGVADLHPQVEALGRTADTLGMMGLGVARNVVLQQRDAMHDIVSGARPADEGALLDIAGALLYVDASLDDQVDRLGRPSEGEEADTIASESRKVLDVLVREAIANFADARQAFVAFVETSWDHAQLTDVPRLLEEVAGALRILELPQPAQYLAGVRRFTENELLGRRRVPNGQQLDTLADALASIEYYLEALRDQRPNRDNILDIARQSLESLRYWPLPDEDTVPAPMDEAPAAVATPESPAVEMPKADAPVVQPRVEAPAPVAAAPVELASTPTAPVAPAPVATGARGGFEATGDEIDDEIREVFLEEFEEEIGHLEQMLPGWRAAPDDMEKLRPIRRVFHTLKGSGRLVGARTLGEFSWKVENMLNRVLDGTRPASLAVVALVDQAFYTLPQLHAALRGEAALTADLAGIEAVADRVAAGEEATWTQSALPAAEMLAAAPAVIEESAVPAVADESDEPTVAAVVDPVLLEILGAEVSGHLVTIDAWLAQAQSRPVAANDGLLRAMHTMNGAFAMTEVPAITNVTGPAETYIRRMLAAHAVPTAEGIAALAATADAIRRTVAALQTASPARVPLLEGLARQVVALRDTLPEAKSPLLPSEPFGEELAAMDLSGFTDLADAAPSDTGLELQEMPAAQVEEALPAEDFSAFLDLADAIPADGGLPINAAMADGATHDGGVEEIVLEDVSLEGVGLEGVSLEGMTLEGDTPDLEFDAAPAFDDAAFVSEGTIEAVESGAAIDAAAIEEQTELEASLLEAERVEAERAEAERLEAERAEAERLEAERLEV